MPNATFEGFKQSSENMMKKFMMNGAIVMVLMESEERKTSRPSTEAEWC